MKGLLTIIAVLGLIPTRQTATVIDANDLRGHQGDDGKSDSAGRD